MKYIKKQTEPKCLQDFKGKANENWQPNYSDFRGNDKKELHQVLLQEQGYICCYCEQKISLDNSHIEHLQPQKIYPDQQLNYHNLLASCPKDRKPKEPQHCGVKKANWYDSNLIVSPLNPKCEDFFTYTGSGEILPTDDLNKHDGAKITIDKLGLNIDKLKDSRKQAIEGLLIAIEGLTETEIKQLAHGFENLDYQGEYLEFWSTVMYFIRKYF